MTQQSHFWVISKGTENEISQKEFDISHVGNPKEPDSDRQSSRNPTDSPRDRRERLLKGAQT